jgi:hypothetical protein
MKKRSRENRPILVPNPNGKDEGRMMNDELRPPAAISFPFCILPS